MIVQVHHAEFHVLSPEEFEILCEEARMLAYDLFNEGVIIHADEAYLNKVKSKFNQTVEREHVTEKRTSYSEGGGKKTVIGTLLPTSRRIRNNLN